MSDLMNRMISTSLDEFKTRRTVSELIKVLQPGDIVMGLDKSSEYRALVKLINPNMECTTYGKPLTMCIIGIRTDI